MCRKVLSLESEIEYMKMNNKTSEGVSDMAEEKEMEMNESLSDIADRKVLSSTPKEKKDQTIEKHINKEMLTC